MAVTWFDGHLALQPEAEGPGQTVEWLVWMKRLPQERMLDCMISGQRVEPAAIDALAGVLSAFHLGAACSASDPTAYLARFEREQAISRELLLRPKFQLGGADQALDRFDRALVQSRAALRTRARSGRIVDGHGDLRPEHVCLLDPLVVIDCLELSAALGQVDPFDEFAFLALECDMDGAAWIGSRLVECCAVALGSAPPASLLHLCTAAHALPRARLAMAHLLEPRPRAPERWTLLAQRYIERAAAALDAFDRREPVSAATPCGSP